MSFLPSILTAKRDAIAAAKARLPQPEVERRAAARRGFRGFAAALDRPGVRVVAEFKRASPSQGDIRPGLDPAATARAYEQGGAAALSILTEAAFFKGSDEDLRRAREAVALPVLRKDFILDPYQVYEAAALGADALLLIVRILDDAQLHALHRLALGLGLDVLTEIFDEADAARARALGATLVGINNRDLAQFTTDLSRATRLATLLTPGTATVALSGIRTAADIRLSVAGGLRRFLVGETLMRAPDPAAALRDWLAPAAAPDTQPATPSV